MDWLGDLPLDYDFCLFKCRQAEEMLEKIVLHLSPNNWIMDEKNLRNNNS